MGRRKDGSFVFHKTLKHGGKEEAEDLKGSLFSYGCRKLILVVQNSFDAISQVNNIEIT
jgi:hypothetical protein